MAEKKHWREGEHPHGDPAQRHENGHGPGAHVYSHTHTKAVLNRY